MGKVKFQVDGIDSNTASEFNQNVTFDGNIDANSISIAGTDIFEAIPPGPVYSTDAPLNPTTGQVWIDSDSSATAYDLTGYATLASPSFTGTSTISLTTTTDSDPLTIQSKNLHGGSGFAGIQTWTNTTTGATNPNKFWRINGSGQLEIVNSAYSATILSLTDGGNLSVAGTINNVALNNDAWTSFTPALSTEFGSWTIGNGSIEASYKLIGKTCHFKTKIVWGSTTSTGSGALQIGLPVTAKDANYQFPVSILDNGNAWYQATGNGMYNNNTSKFAMIFKSSGTGSSSEGVAATAPFTFGSGDYISINGTYEVA